MSAPSVYRIVFSILCQQFYEAIRSIRVLVDHRQEMKTREFSWTIEDKLFNCTYSCNVFHCIHIHIFHTSILIFHFSELYRGKAMMDYTKEERRKRKAKRRDQIKFIDL